MVLSFPLLLLFYYNYYFFFLFFFFFFFFFFSLFISFSSSFHFFFRFLCISFSFLKYIYISCFLFFFFYFYNNNHMSVCVRRLVYGSDDTGVLHSIALGTLHTLHAPPTLRTRVCIDTRTHDNGKLTHDHYYELRHHITSHATLPLLLNNTRTRCMLMRLCSC